MQPVHLDFFVLLSLQNVLVGLETVFERQIVFLLDCTRVIDHGLDFDFKFADVVEGFFERADVGRVDVIFVEGQIKLFEFFGRFKFEIGVGHIFRADGDRNVRLLKTKSQRLFVFRAVFIAEVSRNIVFRR